MAGAYRVSVLIVCYDMVREVPRTVRSFLAPYQTDMSNDEIEILVLDNGSPHPIPRSIQESWPSNVRYVHVPDPSPSPAKALNYGASLAQADILCPVIDGARLASPGLIRKGLAALKTHSNAFVSTVGFHLGHERQQIAAQKGYDQSVEDRLLERINWPENGYRLFEISTLAGSAKQGWFGPMAETNAALLTARLYEELGGFDERFDIPGGGFVNLDFYMRALDREDVPFILLLGEGSFHQFHGGVTTSTLRETDPIPPQARYRAQYEDIRQVPFQFRTRRPILFGTLPEEARQMNTACLTGAA